MRRIWVEPEFVNDTAFDLQDEPFRHAIQVCKFRVGEEFEVVCGQLQARVVRLEEIRKKSAHLKVMRLRELAQPQPPYIHLAFALPKWPVFESVLEKCVELGVQSVQPLLTEFSFTRDIKDISEARRERWAKVIRSATEQTGRGPLMEVREPLSLQEFIRQLNLKSGVAGLFAYEGASPVSFRQELGKWREKKTQEYWAIVGSEGGFSETEKQWIEKSGYPALTLGDQVLRAETACMAIISIIKWS